MDPLIKPLLDEAGKINQQKTDLSSGMPVTDSPGDRPDEILVEAENQTLFETSHKAIILFAGVILLVVMGIWIAFSAFREIEESAQARKHSFTLINHADLLLSSITDAETGQRGFLITGDEAFLEPYLAVRSSVSTHLHELQQRTLSDDARKHLDAIVPLMEAKLAEMARVIELRRSHNMPAVMGVEGNRQGKELMDSIRAEMSAFVQIERGALEQRDQMFQRNLRHLFGIMVGVSFFVLLLALAFAYLIYRESRQKRRNQLQLETQHRLKSQREMNQELQKFNLNLQDSKELISVTLNSIGDAVITTDAEACVTRLNPVAELLTGWTQESAFGRPIQEVFSIINKETRLAATIPVIETLAHGVIQGLANHTVLISRNGSECDIADSCAPICDRDGRVVGAVLVFRNVTEEYSVQQALRDSAAQIQTILNTVVDGIITLHAHGARVETVNPAAEKMFGYSAAELMGQSFSILIPELDQDQINGSLDYYSASEAARAIGLGREVLGRRKDGSSFPLEIAVSEMWLGGQRYFTGILRDITARKEAEAALLKAGALQNAIFNSANFSSIATDAKGVIQIFNVGAERMLGYAAVDVMNKITPADISDPQEVIARAKALSIELSTPITPGFEALVFKASRGIEDIYEITYIRKDGSRFPAVVSVTALRDEKDAIIGYLLIGTDNTARKEIEAEQKQLAQRLRDQQFYTRSLFESNIDALITTDPSGIITDVNKQMEALTGCTRDELIGAPFKGYFTDPELAESSIQLVLSEKKVTNYELTAHARDGKQTVVSYNATTFYDRDRKLQGVFAAARDVTERKRLDQELQENNIELQSARSVAEKANLAKSDFLSSMSHELRSPLNAILGFAQLMESSSPLPSESQKESIAQILQAGWHLLKLINEILDLAVIESGKVSLSLESVSLVEIMSECKAMMETQAQLRGIQMTFPQFDDNAPFFVKADRTRLKQIIINLLSNAIKYNNELGTVIVKCTATSAECTRISFEDTGVGLSPEKLTQLFQPFNRLGQEGSGVAGTGIGLVVTKRLIELMDGKLGVVGSGSIFWAELISAEAPHLACPTSESKSSITTQPSGSQPLHSLLYVEDNPTNMKLVEQIIARHPDLQLLTAITGALGIERARATCPKVILLDINLPDINGIEVLKILHSDPITAHIPIIALSANAMPRDIALGLEAGFFRYLTKPINMNELMDTLYLAIEYTERNK